MSSERRKQPACGAREQGERFSPQNPSSPRPYVHTAKRQVHTHRISGFSQPDTRVPRDGTGRCVRTAHSPHTPPPSGAVRGAACVRGTCGVYACNWRMCGLYGDVNACVRACACAKWGGSYPRGFRCSSFIAWHHHHVTANARCSGTSPESQFGPAPTGASTSRTSVPDVQHKNTCMRAPPGRALAAVGTARCSGR